MGRKTNEERIQQLNKEIDNVITKREKTQNIKEKQELTIKVRLLLDVKNQIENKKWKRSVNDLVKV